jgi:hypothetical protein
MRGKLGRRLAVLVIAVSGVAAVAIGVQPAAGDGSNLFPFNYNVDATTHLKTLDQTIVITGGTFKGAINFGSTAAKVPLSGSITLPDAHFTYQAAGIIPLIDATARIAPTKPVVGTLELSTLIVTATATFNIKIVSAYAEGTTVNLVGDQCKTATPVKVTMSGQASFATPSIFSGTFTIPPLQNCGLGTTALNLVIPGPGNTFTATATPKT